MTSYHSARISGREAHSAEQYKKPLAIFRLESGRIGYDGDSRAA